MSDLSPAVVTITGMAIVFLVLIFLVIIISIFGLFGRMTGKKDKAEKKAPAAKKAAPQAVQKSVSAPQEPKMVRTPVFMEIEDGIPGDVVAAIAAAVAYTSGGRNFAVRSIRRDRSSRSAWGTAGVIDNTRPF